MLRDRGTASGESRVRKRCGWDETAVGAAREEASIGGNVHYAVPADSICRTAVYVTRMYGGVGGGHREVSPYPEIAA